jgi:undecaprenyl-diphosphatase
VRPRVVLTLAYGVASLAVVNVLAAAYSHEPLAEWDSDLAQWVADELPTWVEWLSRPFSWLGGGVGMAAVALVAAILLARRGRTRDASLVALAYVGAQLSTHAIKSATDRPRPELDPVGGLPSTNAFPSGHASVAMAVLVLVPVLLRLGRRWVAVGVALALAIGLSRVALGVHWASDVMAGWALGLAWVAACLAAREVVRSGS